MRCEEAQLYLIDAGDECSKDLREQALRHSQDCRECASLLSFNQRLGEALGSDDPTSKDLMPEIRDAIARAQPTTSRPWITNSGRSTFMKKLILSGASIALVGALAIGLLKPAYAVDAKTKFANLKDAVMAKSKQSKSPYVVKLDGHQIAYSVKLNADGTVLPSIVKSDELVPGVPVAIDVSENGEYNVRQRPLTAEEKAAYEKMVREHGPAQAYINGKPATMEEVSMTLQNEGINISFEIDLDASHYKSIAFGADKNTLVLSPDKKSERYVVQLDEKSSMPKRVTIEQFKNGKWVKEKKSSAVFKLAK